MQLQIMPRLIHEGRNTRKSSSGVTPIYAQIDNSNSIIAKVIVLVVVFCFSLMAQRNVVPVTKQDATMQMMKRKTFGGCADAR
jgi:hypothetical protein